MVHLILDRFGRKRPYCLFAILFGIIAILVIPVQKYTTEDGRGEHAARHLANARACPSSSANDPTESYQWRAEILRLGILCDHLHLRQ